MGASGLASETKSRTNAPNEVLSDFLFSHGSEQSSDSTYEADALASEKPNPCVRRRVQIAAGLIPGHGELRLAVH